MAKTYVNLQFRVAPELVKEMDRQASALRISRAELLRRLVAQGQAREQGNRRIAASLATGRERRGEHQTAKTEGRHNFIAV